jgi:hypothetical protein
MMMKKHVEGISGWIERDLRLEGSKTSGRSVAAWLLKKSYSM